MQARFLFATVAFAFGFAQAEPHPIVIEFSHVVAVDTPKGQAAEYFKKRAEELTGIRGLAYWDNGFKHFSANRPLHAPGDYRDLRMRVQSSMVLEAQMRALGALPQVMAFSEVYPALRAGIVDGTENPVSNLYTQRMYEVQKHVSITKHGYLGYAVIVNEKFWEGLPAGIRVKLELAMKEATAYANRIAMEKNDEDLSRLKSAGTTEVYEPTRDERLALKKVLLSVHAQMEARIGKELIHEIYQATEFDPNTL